jgi:hypothetical protein
MANRIQIRRGLNSARALLDGAADIKLGELLFATDTKRVYIGDGSTDGGYDFVGAQIGATTINVSQLEDAAAGSVITWDASGNADIIGPGDANTVLTGAGSGAPASFSFITYQNIASGDFITNLNTAPAANKFVDAATIRAYVNSQVSGMSWRPPVDMVDAQHTTKPTSTGTTIDGQTIVDGDRVLFTTLDSPEGGDNDQVFIASVSGASVTWTLETDGQAGDGTPTDGDALFIQTGDDSLYGYADQTWVYNGTAWILAASLNGALLASNNLSDLDNTTTALTNLGYASDSRTLTNKTMDADNNTFTNFEHGAEVDNPSSGVHGVVGNVVGTSDAQTLTNKTIDADNNTISNLAHGAEVDDPSTGVHGVGAGSVVGTTLTQTLTNKTIDDDSNVLSIDFTSLKSETAGDMLYWDVSGNPAVLPVGSAGQILTVSGGVPAWSDTGALDVITGPGTSADNEIVRFDGTTGDVIQNGSVARLNDNVVIDSVTYGPLDGVYIDAGTL